MSLVTAVADRVLERPLVRNVVVFSAKYVLAVGAIIHPDARPQLAVWDVVVSGASAGYY